MLGLFYCKFSTISHENEDSYIRGKVVIVCIIWEKLIDKSLPQMGGGAASPRYMDGDIPASVGMTGWGWICRIGMMVVTVLWISASAENDAVPHPVDTALKPVLRSRHGRLWIPAYAEQACATVVSGRYSEWRAPPCEYCLKASMTVRDGCFVLFHPHL